MKLPFMIALFSVSMATAVAQNGSRDVPAGACSDLNQAVMAKAVNGHLAEAEGLLPLSALSGDVQNSDACAGLVLGNMARMMAVLGRIDVAERLAERSVRILQNFYPQNDTMLLGPLQLLAAARLESGNTARAREALRRIRFIRVERPDDSAIVHATTGALLQMEGRLPEAEAEYQDALRAWEEAGRSESADAAAVLHCLCALYLRERRLDEARRALDRAQIVHDRAKDYLPIDRIKFLYLRGVMHARLGEWTQSEQDLCEALSMADRQPYVDPNSLRLILAGYSYVLRRNHHRREARSIEARKAALPVNRTAAALVDSTELLLEKKAARGQSMR